MRRWGREIQVADAIKIRRTRFVTLECFDQNCYAICHLALLRPAFLAERPGFQFRRHFHPATMATHGLRSADSRTTSGHVRIRRNSLLFADKYAVMASQRGKI
jgi:hypothetical protein